MRYDATLKKLFQQPPNRLLSFALGKPVTVARMLPTDLITVENLHPDLLFEDNEGQIIHAEMQGYHMGEFACRNLIYYGLLLRDFKRHPVQIVFWIGRERVGVSDGLSNPPRLDYSYPVVDVREIDADALLEGAGVSESIFAVLCKTVDARRLIGEILQRISTLAPAQQKEAVAQLLVLSGLRGLKAVIELEIARMPFSFDIHENEFLEGIFQDGLEQGIEKGIEKGIAKGVEKGKEEGRLESARQLLMELLEAKFGVVPAPYKERIAHSAFEEIRDWQKSALTSNSIDKIFRSR